MVREKKMPFIPIVALTAYLDEKERCLKAGMSDFCNFVVFNMFSD